MKPIKVYAGYNIDLNARFSSSSGAIFSLLAESILSKNGVIYGVKMTTDCYSAVFTRVTDVEGLTGILGSKYLQAKVGETYIKVKEDLMAGKWVLFSGTGCQVNGLRAFLGRDYDNLLCIDVICHGTPSPALWRKYVEYQEKKNNGKLKYINFRCKDDSWIDFGMKKIINSIPEGEEKEIYCSKNTDAYMQMFLRDYCLRPSCYNCTAKKVKMSDLTLADFWGISNVAPEMNDGKGTSLILIRSKKGEELFKSVSNKMKLKEVSYEDGVRYNPAEYKSCYKPPQRNTFFNDMSVMEFIELEEKYMAPIKVTVKSRVKRMIKNTIASMLKISGGGVSEMEYGLLFLFDCQEINQ